MITITKPATSLRQGTSLNKTPSSIPSGGIIDFFEARHQLLVESEQIDRSFEANSSVRPRSKQKGRLMKLFEVLEEAFYWGISIAVLAYLILGIFLGL